MIKSYEANKSDTLDDKQDNHNSQSNFDLLLKHLDGESLAAKLIKAYVSSDEREQGMVKIIDERLEELKNSHDKAEHKKN